MLRIRLSRKGKKKQPQYRVVVADVKYKRDGRFLENIGTYNPLTDPPTIKIEEARALHWLSVGAQPSDPVKHMLEKQGTYDRLKRLHAGEELDALVAEFSGAPAAEETKEPEAKVSKKEAKKAEEAPAPVEEEAPAEVVAEEAPAEEAPAEDTPAESEDASADEAPADTEGEVAEDAAEAADADGEKDA